MEFDKSGLERNRNCIIGVDKNVTTGNMWTIQHGMIEPLGMTLGW